MNKEDIMKYALIAGGAFAVYWYITNHGPNGAVYAADGVTKVGASYWDTWFGTAAPAPAPPAPAPVILNQAPGTIPPAQQIPGIPTVDASVQPGIDAMAHALTKAANANLGTLMTADQWGYYFNMVATPLTPDQFSAAFPGLTATNRGPGMTAPQFMAFVAKATGWLGVSGVSGLGRVGDVVPVTSRPSIPMMSFGGGLGGGFNAFQQKGKWTN